MRDLLIRYLMDELEPDEQSELEARLEVDEELREELERLRQCMRPAELSEFDPPPALAERTCTWVRFFDEHVRRSCTRSSWRASEMIIAAGICVAAALMIMPAIHQSRSLARQNWCANNLRQLGNSLNLYSEAHLGDYPAIPTQGPLSNAGLYAPILVDQGYVADPRILACPGQTGFPAAPELPTMAQLRAAGPRQLARWRETMGGSYAYTLGYYQNGAYYPTRNLRRTHAAVAADAPSLHLAGLQSANHEGNGQNVLFEAGNVRFMPKPGSDIRDNIYTNSHGHVTAGTGLHDAVLGASGVSPRRPFPVEK